MLTGTRILLRTPQPRDVEPLFRWESDPEVQQVAGSDASITREEFEGFVNGFHDLHTEGQLRLMVCLQDRSEAIGCIDLFGYDPVQRCAGIGILIDGEFRRQGYALEALETLKSYAFGTLHLQQLFANVEAVNTASRHLFERAGFKPGAALYELAANEKEQEAVIGYALEMS